MYSQQQLHIVVLSIGVLCASRPLCGQTSYSESTVYNLAESDGSNPTTVIQGADGNLYGIAITGGLETTSEVCPSSYGGCGTIFKISASGVFSVLYTFQGSTDGAFPFTLLQGADGNLYGTAVFGGIIPTNTKVCHPDCTGGGTLFSVSTGGEFRVLYSFGSQSNDGGYPISLIQASDGDFYGTTYGNTVFKVSSVGAFTTLHTFAVSEGQYPTGIVQGSDGYLYGATQAGGNSTACYGFGCGTIYKMSLSGTLTLVDTLSDSSAEAKRLGGSIKEIVIRQPGHMIHQCSPYPCASISTGVFNNAFVEESDGSFYGTTSNVFVTDGSGHSETLPSTVFKIAPTGNVSTIYTFTGVSDGGGTSQSLFLAGDGAFYGTSNNVLFQVTPAGDFNSIYTGNSSLPAFAALIQGDDGALYSEAQEGGNTSDCSGNGCGAIFSISAAPALPAPVQLTLSSQTAPLGSTVQLDWSVSNAFSLSMQQCFAFIQNAATTAGEWAGLQPGAISGSHFVGSSPVLPTHAGTYTYALTCGGIESGFATLTIPGPSITTSSLPDAQIAMPYSQTLAAAGGLGPYTWSLTAGSLPPGLILTQEGTLSGTPTQAGSFSFTVQVTDSENPATTATANLNLAVPDFSLKASATTLTIIKGQQGSEGLTVTGIGGYALSVTFSCSGLPSESSCRFSPATAAPSSNGTPTTLTITTTASSALARGDSFSTSHGPLTGALVCALICFWFPRLSRKRTAERLFLLILGLAFFASASGCGGNSGTKPPSNPGTPLGTVPLTITATSTGTGAETHSITLTVTISD